MTISGFLRGSLQQMKTLPNGSRIMGTLTGSGGVGRGWGGGGSTLLIEAFAPTFISYVASPHFLIVTDLARGGRPKHPLFRPGAGTFAPLQISKSRNRFVPRVCVIYRGRTMANIIGHEKRTQAFEGFLMCGGSIKKWDTSRHYSDIQLQRAWRTWRMPSRNT